MKHYLINNNSDKLLLFFTGWGCDETEFEHLASDADILLLYDYVDLSLNFDFSKYIDINLIAFSAGVFVASVFDFKFKPKISIAIDGNPYLFDEKLGLSRKVQYLLSNITEENAEFFAKNFLVKTEEEYQMFHHSKRTVESCLMEFDLLKTLYDAKKQDIKDIYDYAIFGDEDMIFNLLIQKEFYKNRIYTINNARHNVFFRIKGYSELFDLVKQN